MPSASCMRVSAGVRCCTRRNALDYKSNSSILYTRSTKNFLGRYPMPMLLWSSSSVPKRDLGPAFLYAHALFVWAELTRLASPLALLSPHIPTRPLTGESPVTQFAHHRPSVRPAIAALARGRLHCLCCIDELQDLCVRALHLCARRVGFTFLEPRRTLQFEQGAHPNEVATNERLEPRRGTAEHVAHRMAHRGEADVLVVLARALLACRRALLICVAGLVKVRLGDHDD
mmetsp:Transcript_56548/g.112284  ORF Transcript_56548/g.112284 Transcript_56548/m.112284 type:complete len:230 (+) Transcript_56548:213-902(+)